MRFSASAKKSVAAWTVILAVLAAPAPRAGAEVVLSERVPISLFVENRCDGERILVEGYAHISIRRTTDASGGTHLSSHFNYQDVSGVSMETGDTYRVVNVNNGNSITHAVEDGASVISMNFTIRLVGQGPDNDFTRRGVVHLTENNNGDPTSVHVEMETGCQ